MYTKLNIIYILIFLVTLFVSCTDDSEIKDFPSNKESKVKSLWTFPETVDVGFSGKHTRISYTDNGTQGIKQNWESGDQFILYNTSGESVTYTISEIDSSDSSVATFELNSDQTALEGNVFYAVYDNGNVNVTFSNELPIYNLATTGQTQNGADSNVLSHLKNYDLITTGAIDDIDQDIEFSSDGVLLTFSLSNISTDFGAPKSLQIEIIGTPENVFSTNYNVDGDTTLFKLNLEGYDSLTTSLNA